MPFLAMSIVQRTNFKYLQLHLDWDLLTRLTCSKRRKMTQTCWILLIYFWGPWSPLPNPSLYRTHSEHLIPDTTKPCLEFFVNPQQWLFDSVKSHFEQVAQFLRCQRQTKNYNPQENLGLSWLFFALYSMLGNWLESVLDLNHLRSVIRGLCTKCCWVGGGNWHAARFTDWQ